jgi:hypothetical protein
MEVRAADYWERAMAPEHYIAQMSENRELFAERVAATSFSPGELDMFAGQPLRILAITEDYCGDSAQFIPPLIRLASDLDTVEIRILLRPACRALADQYRRKDGYQAIPVLILMDEQGRELGYLIERPERTYAELAAETRRFAASHPELEGVSRAYANMPPATKEAVRANADRFRATQQAGWTRWLLEDLAAIIASGRARSGATAAD